jgi:hypothetical protein
LRGARRISPFRKSQITYDLTAGVIQRRVKPTDGVAIPRIGTSRHGVAIPWMKDKPLEISRRLEVLSVVLPRHPWGIIPFASAGNARRGSWQLLNQNTN